MQTVEGSNPFSRSQRPAFAGLFLRAQSHCSSASGRTDSGLAAGRSSAVPRKTPCLQADSGSSEPKSFLRTCRRSGVRPAAAVIPTPAATARSCGAPAGAIPAVALLGGQSGFSPETARSASTRSATLASHGTQSRELSVGRRPRQRRGPRHGKLVSRQSHGGHREGVAFHRQAGVRAHLGWAACCRPERKPGSCGSARSLALRSGGDDRTRA